MWSQLKTYLLNKKYQLEFRLSSWTNFKPANSSEESLRRFLNGWGSWKDEFRVIKLFNQSPTQLILQDFKWKSIKKSLQKGDIDSAIMLFKNSPIHYQSFVGEIKTFFSTILNMPLNLILPKPDGFYTMLTTRELQRKGVCDICVVRTDNLKNPNFVKIESVSESKVIKLKNINDVVENMTVKLNNLQKNGLLKIFEHKKIDVYVYYTQASSKEYFYAYEKLENLKKKYPELDLKFFLRDSRYKMNLQNGWTYEALIDAAQNAVNRGNQNKITTIIQKVTQDSTPIELAFIEIYSSEKKNDLNIFFFSDEFFEYLFMFGEGFCYISAFAIFLGGLKMIYTFCIFFNNFLLNNVFKKKS